MSVLDLTSEWPVPHVSAAILHGGKVASTTGDVDRVQRLASISKPMTAWAILVAVEEGVVSLDQPVGQPERVHPKRPIQGFQCTRSEVSGQRLWTWAQQRWGQPERFFDDCYVHNFCPLIFMADSGRNITPDKLAREEREAVYGACEASLADLVSLVQPECIVAVGVFAEARARSSCAEIPVHKMPHPSPASPAANRGWSDLANAVFDDLGIGERP